MTAKIILHIFAPKKFEPSPKAYFVPTGPAFTLGRSFPRWSRWIMCLKSIVFPDSGSIAWSVWQRMQSGTSRRPPPWNASGSWQALHCAVVVSSMTVVTGLPFGTKWKTGFATSSAPSNSRSICPPTVCVRPVGKPAGSVLPKVYVQVLVAGSTRANVPVVS